MTKKGTPHTTPTMLTTQQAEEKVRKALAEMDDEAFGKLVLQAGLEQYDKQRRELMVEILQLNLKLRSAINEYEDLVLPFLNLSKEYIRRIRDHRMAIVSEISPLLGPLREVRQFFLSKEYHEEMSRLREFVELCERLKVLKDSGFLDTVADTMLRLAVAPEQNGGGS